MVKFFTLYQAKSNMGETLNRVKIKICGRNSLVGRAQTGLEPPSWKWLAVSLGIFFSFVTERG